MSARSILAAALAAILAGCVSPGVQPAEPMDPTVPGASDSVDDEAPAATEEPPVEEPDPLTDFEEALAGTWRRYHVKNSGYSSEHSYYEYVSFNENRTACKWKYGEESSSSSTDEVFDEGDYSDWRITEELSGGAAFRVVVQGRGLDYVFDFAENIVYPAGFDTLVFYPNTDGKSCYYRHGASY